MKLQMTPRFPANVVGQNGVAITKANGTYTFSSNLAFVGTGAANVTNNGTTVTINVPNPVSGSIPVLTGNATYNVTPGAGLYPTLQAAWDASTQVDANGFSIIIQCPHYTDTGGLIASTMARNAANIFIWGDQLNPTNCKITTTNKGAMLFEKGVKVQIDGFQLSTITAGNSLTARTGAQVLVGAIAFDSCSPADIASNDLLCDSGASVTFLQSYTKTGNTGGSHHHVLVGGNVAAANITITQVGTPVYGGYFAGVAGGFVGYAFTNFVGGCNGRKYYVHYDGTIATSGQTLPGSVAGSNLGGNIDDRMSFSGDNDAIAPVATQVGELIEASAPAGNITFAVTDTDYTICFIDLTGGVWDVQANGEFTQQSDTVVTQIKTCISESAAFDSSIGRYAARGYPTGTVLHFTENTLTTPAARILVAKGTSKRIYLVSRGSFSVNTMAGGGILSARRPA